MVNPKIRRRKSKVLFDDEDNRNRPAILQRIKEHARNGESSRCYVLPAEEFGIVTSGSCVENVIVVPLLGKESREFDSDHSRIFAAVHPRPDGARIACLMLANEAVALTLEAPHCANASLDDDFQVLWVFDTEALLSTYTINDDVNESMWIASEIAEDHNPLTQAEVEAWKQVAAQNPRIVVSEVCDLTEEGDRLNNDSFWAK
jgi:hypothetical protein